MLRPDQSGFRSNARRVVLLRTVLVAITLLSGCTLGPMQIYQQRYLAVPSGDNVNYYRVRISGNTKLGKAEFRSGWYPRDAVDSLFGDVSDNGAIKALKTRQDLKEEVNKSFMAARKAYLAAAVDPDTSEETLRALLRAEKRVVAGHSDLTPLPGTAILWDYQPGKDLQLRNSDDKFVFVLSSNPDEVIGAIANFAEHQQTSVQVTRLAEVITQQAVNTVAESEARTAALTATDELLLGRLQQAAATAADSGASHDAIVHEVEALLVIVDGLK